MKRAVIGILTGMLAISVLSACGTNADTDEGMADQAMEEEAAGDDGGETAAEEGVTEEDSGEIVEIVWQYVHR